MIVIGLILVVVFCAVGGYMFWRTSDELPIEHLDPEEAVKAAVELHAIRRRLDVSLTKSEQRRDAQRLRRTIGETLDEFDDAR